MTLVILRRLSLAVMLVFFGVWTPKLLATSLEKTDLDNPPVDIEAEAGTSVAKASALEGQTPPARQMGTSLCCVSRGCQKFLKRHVKKIVVLALGVLVVGGAAVGVGFAATSHSPHSEHSIEPIFNSSSSSTGLAPFIVSSSTGSAPPPPTPPLPPPPPPPGSRRFDFLNLCDETIWAAALNGDAKSSLPDSGGWEMKPGTNHTVYVNPDFSGRFWPRTACAFDGGGRRCLTGDCGGGSVACAGRGGEPPVSLLEFTLNGYQGHDFYDISNVDGPSIDVAILAVGRTAPPGDKYYCGSPSCRMNLTRICPPERSVYDGSGTRVVACRSDCAAEPSSDAACCRGDHGTPDTCDPSATALLFKDACPDAYSYAYDDTSSTYRCPSDVNLKYQIVFCPKAAHAMQQLHKAFRQSRGEGKELPPELVRYIMSRHANDRLR